MCMCLYVVKLVRVRGFGFVYEGGEEDCIEVTYQRRMGARRGEAWRCGKMEGCTLAAVEKLLVTGFIFVN